MRNGHTASLACAHLALSYLVFTQHALSYKRHEVSLCLCLKCLFSLFVTSEGNNPRVTLRHGEILVDLACLVSLFVGKC